MTCGTTNFKVPQGAAKQGAEALRHHHHPLQGGVGGGASPGAESRVEQKPRLTHDQGAFLAFAVAKPAPFAWRWLKADGSISLGPSMHAYLAARKRTKGVEIQARVTLAEFEALQPYWAHPLIELNEAGRAAVDGRQGGKGVGFPGPNRFAHRHLLFDRITNELVRGSP